MFGLHERPLTYQCIIKADHHQPASETPFDSNGISLTGRWWHGTVCWLGYSFHNLRSSILHLYRTQRLMCHPPIQNTGKHCQTLKSLSRSLLRANSNVFFAQTACANIHAHSDSYLNVYTYSEICIFWTSFIHSFALLLKQKLQLMWL